MDIQLQIKLFQVFLNYLCFLVFLNLKENSTLCLFSQPRPKVHRKEHEVQYPHQSELRNLNHQV